MAAQMVVASWENRFRETRGGALISAKPVAHEEVFARCPKGYHAASKEELELAAGIDMEVRKTMAKARVWTCEKEVTASLNNKGALEIVAGDAVPDRGLALWLPDGWKEKVRAATGTAIGNENCMLREEKVHPEGQGPVTAPWYANPFSRLPPRE